MATVPKALGDFVVHLRVPFQLALAPFFLLGSLAARDRLGAAWLGAFVLVHVGIYGGATVYNSYYDEDVGPIGMLKRPPVVTRGMLVWSIVLQLASAAALVALSLPAGGLALAMLALSVAYSHPGIRLKGVMLPGLAVVAIGQGAMAVLLGYYCVTETQPSDAVFVVAAAASLLVLGLYPLTQIYQIDEDLRRGDMTMPVRLGWRFTMLFSTSISSAGLAFLVFALKDVVPSAWPWGAALGAVSLAAYVAVWWRRFEAQSACINHDWAMRLSAGVAAPTTLLVVYKLLARWG